MGLVLLAGCDGSRRLVKMRQLNHMEQALKKLKLVVPFVGCTQMELAESCLNAGGLVTMECVFIVRSLDKMATKSPRNKALKKPTGYYRWTR